MGGLVEMVGGKKILEQVLTEDEIKVLLNKVGNGASCELICSEIWPASEGLCGYLGDHHKAVLHVKVNDGVQKVQLFIKTVPENIKAKAYFIEKNNFFKREKLMYQILDEVDGDTGPNPWHVKAYVCTDRAVVLPELTPLGYTCVLPPRPLSAQQARLAAAAAARLHAAFAIYNCRRTLASDTPYDFYREHEHILQEPTFQDTPWVRTGAKLSADLLDAFSTKYNKTTIPDLESKLAKSFVEACDSFFVAEGTLNVLTHRDLWNNNIMFKYEEGEPINVILIDFQCLRYGPPAFDVTSLLYLTCSREVREQYENVIFKHYFRVFSESLDDVTRKTLDALGYDEKEFLSWCEKARLFGIFQAVAINPQVLMDPKTGEEIFANPDTFLSMVEEDRSGPVVEYARTCPLYRQRQMEILDEYVERYILRIL